MGTLNGIQRPFPFTYALSLDEHVVQHTCGAHCVSWSPTLQPKYKKYAFFIVGVIRHFLGKCHFSANIAEVIRIICALLEHFYKYTTQCMTVQCQLQLSRHNSHERTWGHHLQYDRFRTTLKRADRQQFYWSCVERLQRADHVISSWNENYGARLEWCQLLKTET